MPQSMGELEYDQQPRNQERSPKKKEKKWTLGSLFRRKKAKDTDSDSSDSDAVEEGKKGGFLARRRRRRAANRGSKDVSQSFEHVILRPNAATNLGTDVKKSIKKRVEASRDSLLKDSSSEEECSPRTKTRAPRSKRSSRDMTDCNMKLMELDSSPRSPRWTAKVVYCESSDYDARYTAHTRSATPSPAQSPIAKVKHLKRPPIPQSNVPRPLHCQKSASFDILPRQSQHYQHPPTPPHHHHHQPTQLHSRVPPPPPPRDPQRKIIPPIGYQLERPLSYAFESNQPLPKIMTDHNSNITAYKNSSSCSLDHQPVYKINSSGSFDPKRNYQYYTDQQPRSRKPIHIARVDQPYLSDSQIGRVRTNDWRLPRDSNSSLCDSSDSREGGTDIRPLSMVVETAEQQVPTRELPDKKELKRKSSNLEDALNELEAIYKSLQLRDEEPPLRGFESDSGCYRVVDDMAYRRLNRKESRGSPDCRRVVSQAGSYLLVSPTLSPPPFATAPPIPPPQNEPDVTLDDVVYRNIRHTNNTLKVADPQPLFGIPIGPVAPAPSSDYLHATPKQLYRPTFKPRKTPDVVKDDLAYRNLRKDGQHDSLLSTEDCLLNENPSILKKKRAVRSLSANLLSIIQKEQFRIENQNIKNFNYDMDNFEKTQSYPDLPDIIDTRYKRSYSTEDSDVTPRVSRMYPDMPISTTSTETLTDSRANLMNAQESCSSKNQYLPFTNKPLPKTDFAKLRLPSPNSHQISSPKKFLYGDNSACLQNSAERKKFEKAVNNQINGSSSPNNSSRTKTMLMSAERNNSKSPSPYYSACETPPLSNSNKFTPAYESGKNNTNSKKNSTSNSKSVSGELNLKKNGIPSPTSWKRGSLHQRENDALSSCETKSYYNGNSGKLHYLSDQGFENRRCISQSPRVDIQLVKSENNEKNLQSSSCVNDLHSRSPDKIKKFNLDQSSPTQYAHGINNNMSVKNDFDRTSLELAQEDFIADLQPVPLNPPKISIREGVAHEVQKMGKFLIPSRPVSVSSTGISPNCSKVNPKVTENKISIEGIQLIIPTANKTSVGSNKTSELNSREKIQQVEFTSPSVPSTSCINTVRIQSPQMSRNLEKSHQTNDARSSLYESSSIENADNQCKNIKTVVSHPWSPISTKSIPSEKSKESSPRHRSTIIHENCEDNTRIPSPSSYLNPEKSSSDFRKKSQSSSPRLSIETNISRLPSPQLLVTSDKLPVQENCGNSSSNWENFMNTVENNSGENFEITNTSSNSTRLQKCSQLSKPHNIDESADSRSTISSSSFITNINSSPDVANQSISETINKDIYNDSLLKSRKLNETVPKNSGNNSSLNDTINMSSPSLNVVSKEESLSSNNLSCESDKDDHSKTSGSSTKIGKDLNQLLTEINTKQGEILSGKVKNTSSGHATSTDKRDSLSLGKINPHKPVILTTFSINDNDTIENNETIIVPNRENEIIGTSESMTDLLRELTRSLDQDFGCREKENDDKNCIDYGEKEIERTINDTFEEDILNSNSKSSDSHELNNTDEADNEVMEINRSALEQSEIKERKSVVKNGNNENLTGFVAVKGKHCKTIGVKYDDFNQTSVESTNKVEPTDVKDKQGYYSDDSNAEFVEEICKTASELSALSSTTNVTSMNGKISSQIINTDSTEVLQSQPQQFQGSSSDQNEGERS